MRVRIPADIFREHRVYIALAVCLGVLGSASLFSHLRAQESWKTDCEFTHQAEQRMSAARAALESRIFVVSAIRAFFNASESVSRAEFATMAEAYIAEYEDITSLAWIPNVLADRRASFEAAAREDGFDSYQFVERGIDGTAMPAAAREAYFPVYYLEPYVGNAIEAGWDLGTDPRIRSVLDRARDTGRALSPAPATTVDDVCAEVEIFIPVYDTADSLYSVRQRRANLLGYIRGTYKFDNLMRSALVGLNSVDIAMQVWDVTHPERRRALCSGALASLSDDDYGQGDAGRLSLEQSWDCVGRRIALRCEAGPQFAREHQTWTPFVGLVGGLLVTAVLAAWATAVAGRSREVEQLVQRRTSELAESEARQRAVTENSAEGIITVDGSARVLTWNPVATGIFGYAADEIVGQDLADAIMPPERRETIRRALAHWTDTGEAPLAGQPLEESAVRKDGSSLFCELTITSYHTDAGLVGCVFARDVSDRVRATEALRASEERFQLAMRGASDGLWDWDLAADTVYYSPRLLAILGFEPGEFDNTFEAWSSRVHPDDVPDATAHFREYMDSRDLSYSNEFRMRHKDGHWVHILSRAIGVRDDEGRVLRMVGTHVDLTERKQTQEQIRIRGEQEKALNALLRIGLESCSLEAQLDQALDVVLSLPWLALRPAGAILLMDEKSGHVELRAQRGLEPELLSLCARVPLGYCLCGRAAESGEVVFADCVDHRHDVRFDGMMPHGHYVVPIRSGERVLGVLTLYVNAGDKCDPGHEEFLASVAHTLAVIIDRRLVEDQLALQSAALSSAANAIVITDHEGAIKWVNPAFEQLTGYAASEVMGENPRLLKSDEHDEMFYSELWATITAGEAWHGEVTNRRKDGTLYSEDMAVTPVRDSEGKISHFIAIKQDITARKTSEQRLVRIQTAVDDATDAFIVVESDGRVSYVNMAFCDMFRSTLELVNEHGWETLFADSREAREMFECVMNLDSWQGEVQLTRQGAGTFHADVRAAPILDSPLDDPGILLAVSDITARKQAEAELETVNQQLRDASRQAGMAEVATGVLHNVGNVLNSVNISATVVRDHVRNSKLQDLHRAVSLAGEHREDLASFVSEHPRGKHLLPFLTQLSEHLSKERDTILRELGSLTENIEHIKHVVATQQSLARNASLLETVALPDLLEDAIGINNASFLRHDITLVKDYAELPPVVADKHRVLQILVNLLRNARQALTESTCAERRLTLRTARVSEDLVSIQVVDNGMGISEENMTRVFSHGFTTRKDGHGFGLHSSALTAKEMGGSLTAHSDGPGTGATFTLQLPVAQPVEK